MYESRTSKSIVNARVSLFFYFVQIVLGFFSRKAFFSHLGSEVLGLNTTATNLIGFLNLAELGVSSAVAFFLYKPLFSKDLDSINKIISIQGWIYRRIALFILGGSCILMCFFPLIFAKSPLPLWYAYSTFCALLFSAILGYFFNYRQIILTADQKNYVVQRVTQGLKILMAICQIVAISYFSNPFLWWILLEVIFAIITCKLLDRAIKKSFPQLQTNILKGKEYLKEYPEILKKTRQIFIHKISAVILQQSSPLIVYGFTSLTTVAYYGNYILIIGKLSTLVSTIFNSTGAAIGNLVASKENQRIHKVFWELFESRLCITAIILICAYHLTNPFITIWLGTDYLLSNKFLLIFIILQGIMMTRTTVDSFINAHGLYQDIFAPLSEAILNIFLSISLGHVLGLEGVLMGTSLSMIIIVECWKPYFLFTKGFHISPWNYFTRTTRDVILIIIISILSKIILKYIPYYECRNNSYIEWGFFSFTSLIIVSIISSITFFCVTKGFRDFVVRIIKIKNR